MTMKNEWKTIWEKRSVDADALNSQNPLRVFTEGDLSN